MLYVLYALTAIFIGLSVYLAIASPSGAVWSVLTYVCYGGAAILLGYTVYTAVIYLPTVVRRAKERMKRHRLFEKVFENYDFNTLFFAGLSLVVNVAYAVMNAVSAFKYSSVWYGAFAVYYFTLILFRGLIVLLNAKSSKRFGSGTAQYELAKIKIYIFSGAVLVLITVAMSAVVTQRILVKEQVASGQIMMIANAAYTFYRMAMAIVNFVRAKKFRDPVVQSLRNLNLVNACMAMLSLTVGMIATFGGGDAMLAVECVIGFATCAISLAVATVMLIRGNKLLKSASSNLNELERKKELDNDEER